MLITGREDQPGSCRLPTMYSAVHMGRHALLAYSCAELTVNSCLLCCRPFGTFSAQGRSSQTHPLWRQLPHAATAALRRSLQLKSPAAVIKAEDADWPLCICLLQFVFHDVLAAQSSLALPAGPAHFLVSGISLCSTLSARQPGEGGEWRTCSCANALGAATMAR